MHVEGEEAGSADAAGVVRAAKEAWCVLRASAASRG